MIAIDTILEIILAFETMVTIITLFTTYKFLIKPFLKFRKHKRKRKGYYVDIHKFDDKTGEYQGTLEDQSISYFLDYIGKYIFGVTKPKTVNERIRSRINSYNEKNMELVIDAVMKNNKVHTAMQKKILKQVMSTLGDYDDGKNDVIK